MISELLGLAGSGIAGSVFGIFSDWMQSRSDNARLDLELKAKIQAQEQGQILDHVSEITSRPAFAFAFCLLVATYCICAIICFVDPSIELATFDQNETPKTLQLLWGFFTIDREQTKIYTITTGGVGYALLHPLAFQIGTVITGLNASKRG